MILIERAAALAAALVLSASTLSFAAEPAPAALSPDSQSGGPMLAILCYHHVDSSIRSAYSVSSAQLNAQLDALEKRGFAFVSPAQVEAFYAKGSPLPPKSALITFDDGNLDVYANGYPLLRKRGIPFAFYVYPNAVNRGHAIHCVSWDDLREMAANGVTIGSHSMSHPILTRPPKGVVALAAYDRWLDREIVGSKAAIERNLGLPVTEFAVPFGAFDRYVYGKIKAAGYSLGLNVHGAIADSRADPLNLNRVIILSTMSMERFIELCDSPPLYFDSTTPADLQRVDVENTEVTFELDGADAIDESTVQSHVTSFAGLELRHVKDGDLFVEKVDLKRPAFYEVFVSARDRKGRLCRGAWLFMYDRAAPSYLLP
jgi:peptidoglycan/xylan/chitin deacetylase (PgdA/CDA1 family)